MGPLTPLQEFLTGWGFGKMLEDGQDDLLLLMRSQEPFIGGLQAQDDGVSPNIIGQPETVSPFYRLCIGTGGRFASGALSK